MKILSEVVNFIHRQGLLSPGDRVLVAVSGGPDSVALLHLLQQLAPQFALHLEVGHLQHGIRGEEAKRDAEFVARLAENLGLPFHLKEVDLPQMRTTAGRGNLEALAREERYRFLAAVAGERGLGKVATAHTLDDQAETFLMRLLRGSGRKGLAGMAAIRPLGAGPEGGVNGVQIIRPLLGVSKAEVLEFLREKQLNYCLDQTNQDVSLLRNWVRLDLLPRLSRRIDSNLPRRLSEQAKIIRDESRLLERLAGDELNKVRARRGLLREPFLSQEKAMQRLMLRRWIEETRRHLRGIDFDHIEASLNFIAEGPPQGGLALPGGWQLVREYDTMRLERSSVSLTGLCYSYDLRIGQDLRIGEAGLTIESTRVASAPAAFPDSLMEAILDAAHIFEPLLFRNFRAGDRFRPLGMVGHKKVKDLFIDNKIPLSVRASLPLLVMGKEVLWIPGYGRSEVAKIGARTNVILRLKAVPIRS